jgi:hypothetical protein
VFAAEFQAVRQTGLAMSRKAKQAERLATVESDLRARLTTELESVAGGKNALFFVTAEFNPHDLPEQLLPRGTAELSDLASEALELSEILDDPRGAPVATLFRRYLARANNLTDHHRPGPARLAREMLDELTTLET